MLSIVTTLYKSEQFVEEFCRRTLAVGEKVSSSLELILVDDGSPDGSLAKALECAKGDPRITVVELARNFGHHRALMTGLEVANGDLVFLIDSDLEEAPEDLERFHAKLVSEKEVDVVYGVQEQRKGGFFEKWTGDLFYLIFNYLSDTKVPANFVTSRLMTRHYVDALLEYKERELFLGGIWALTGFRQEPIVVKKDSRGSSSYTLRKRISLFVNSITSFSNKPLVLIFYIGLVLMFIALLAGSVLVALRLSGYVFSIGWSSLMLSLWFLGGLTIFSLGVVGIYISKIFTETKIRPYVTIRKMHGARYEA